MEVQITERIENYKKDRQEWVDKQSNYQWTIEERESGSTTYGFYQERELMFIVKILELEWVLSILE